MPSGRHAYWFWSSKLGKTPYKRFPRAYYIITCFVGGTLVLIYNYLYFLWHRNHGQEIDKVDKQHQQPKQNKKFTDVQNKINFKIKGTENKSVV